MLSLNISGDSSRRALIFPCDLSKTGAMFQPSYVGNIFRYALPLLTACLILPADSRVASAQDAPQIAGTRRGNSACAVPNSPCRDEVNVYRFSEISGKPNRFSCTAGRAVDGREIVTGQRRMDLRCFKAPASDSHPKRDDSAHLGSRYSRRRTYPS